jgi:hypothetical protein
MVKFEKLDYGKWTEFRLDTKSHLNAAEFELVCQLHAKYLKHKYQKPCTCNPKRIKQWIKDLNNIWDNGIKEN